ncbi:MAG: histone deacetylase [Saprospiraceae bacterium]|nr:histone deacetylase [Saprospiraceae bacterium]
MLKIAFSPVYRYELPEGHRFPMAKYELLPEQLLWEGTITESHFFHPDLLEEAVALLTHTPEWWSKMNENKLSPKEIRAIGFPINEKFVRRGRHISNGTLQCARFALEHGCAMNIAGGTHHAFADRGEGFCCFNDQAVAANWLLREGLVQKILIVDLDVHQGNGTASIFADEPRVFTFSMHGERNYPTRKEKSDLDIGLPDGIEDAAYLHILRETLPRIADTFQPDFVFYQSGVDILASDKLGRLNISREGCRERDRVVFNFCKKNRLPVVASMGGGYSPRIADIVEAHANTFRVAQELFF